MRFVFGEELSSRSQTMRSNAKNRDKIRGGKLARNLLSTSFSGQRAHSHTCVLAPMSEWPSERWKMCESSCFGCCKKKGRKRSKSSPEYNPLIAKDGSQKKQRQSVDSSFTVSTRNSVGPLIDYELELERKLEPRLHQEEEDRQSDLIDLRRRPWNSFEDPDVEDDRVDLLQLVLEDQAKRRPPKPPKRSVSRPKEDVARANLESQVPRASNGHREGKKVDISQTERELQEVVKCVCVQWED